jgi:hypothetical protein
MLRRLLAVLAGLLVPLCALPSGAATRVLVVYPFAVSSTAADDMGKQITDKIAAEITALGGVQVVRGAAATKPADYRTAAQAAGADYYYSGSVVPVFTSYSAIEHLVSTRTGTVTWSVTIHFKTLAEVIGEGERVRNELFRGEKPPPGIAPSGASLVTPPPMSGFAVLPVTGSAPDADRQFATHAIVEALQQRGYRVVTVTSANPIDAVANGPEACTTTGAQGLIAGTLDTSRVATPGTEAQTTAHVALRAYDCRSHALDVQATVVNHIAPVGNDAINGAVVDAVSAFPSPS